MVSLEVCIDSLESAKAIAHIVNQGTNRVELCGSLIYGGGLTPSIGLVKAVASVIEPSRIMMMIRLRTGSFIYTQDEVNTMILDIKTVQQEVKDIRGFVFGCLTPDGQVDVGILKQVMAAVDTGREVTFHRAFDLTTDWNQALETVVASKITRILTSGHGKTALEGTDELKTLIQKSKGRIIITPASGINPSTITTLRERLPDAEEVHMSGSSSIVPQGNPVLSRGGEMGFGVEEWKIDAEKVEAVWEVIRDWD